MRLFSSISLDLLYIHNGDEPSEKSAEFCYVKYGSVLPLIFKRSIKEMANYGDYRTYHRITVDRRIKNEV